MIWRAVAVSFSEAHPFLFILFYVYKYSIFFSSNVPASESTPLQRQEEDILRTRQLRQFYSGGSGLPR